MKRCVYDRVAEALQFLSDPEMRDASKEERVTYAVLMFTGAVGHAIAGLAREEVETHGPQIKADVLRCYDEFLAPLDLPGVPNIVESFVDQMIRSILEAGLTKGITRLQLVHERMEQLLAEEE